MTKEEKQQYLRRFNLVTAFNSRLRYRVRQDLARAGTTDEEMLRAVSFLARIRENLIRDTRWA